MKIAIVGSRSLNVEIPENLIPKQVEEIYSGAAKGIDTSARIFAQNHHILITDILPEYELYGRHAPLIRNDLIISLSDKVFVFWDGKSKGTGYIIKKCKETGKPYVLYIYKEKEFALLEQYPAD